MDGNELYQALLTRYKTQRGIAAALDLTQPCVCNWKGKVPSRHHAKIHFLLGTAEAPPSSEQTVPSGASAADVAAVFNSPEPLPQVDPNGQRAWRELVEGE